MKVGVKRLPPFKIKGLKKENLESIEEDKKKIALQEQSARKDPQGIIVRQKIMKKS
jgi:hypothetical protein